MSSKNASLIGLILPIFFASPLFATTGTPLNDSIPDPVFSTFEGIVYKIPVKRLNDGYGNDILRLPVVDTIHWEQINFPDSDVEETPFPGVSLKQGL